MEVNDDVAIVEPNLLTEASVSPSESVEAEIEYQSEPS